MTERSVSERADFLSRRRARTLPALAIIYFAQQATFLSALGNGSHRDVDHFKIGAWVVLSAVLLLALVTKGFWFQPKEIRDLIDDESTRANRLEAMRLGFLLAIFGALAAYFFNQIEPLTVGEAIQLVVSLSLGAALIRFAILERRAHRYG